MTDYHTRRQRERDAQSRRDRLQYLLTVAAVIAVLVVVMFAKGAR